MLGMQNRSDARRAEGALCLGRGGGSGSVAWWLYSRQIGAGDELMGVIKSCMIYQTLMWWLPALLLACFAVFDDDGCQAALMCGLCVFFVAWIVAW